ncbi:MAG: FAD-binding oxidoreductase, partial [Gaiellaceae bacterium]
MNRRELLVRAAGLGAALAVPNWAGAAADPRLKSLAAAVRGPVLARGGAGYALARLEYDSAYDAIKPLAVVQPLDAADVASVVRWAAKTGVHIVARSGGHSYGGYSTVANGVVVDLQRLKAVTVSQGHASVGAGARLGNIYNGLATHGLAIPAGTCPSVGIGGHALGGGFGLASRAWGLASDNVLAVQIATADGKLVVADAKHNPDLYWACRGGGGGNFGLATRFTFRTHAVTQGSYFVATWPWSQATDVVASFLTWAPHQPDALGALCRLAAGPGGPTIQVFGQFLGSETSLKSALASLGPPAAKLTTGTATWLDLVRRWAGCLGHPLPECAIPGHTLFAGASDYIAKVPASAQLAKFTAVVEARGASSGALLIDAYGGALNRIAPAATAFVHRNQLASIQYFAAGNGASARGWVDGARAALKP